LTRALTGFLPSLGAELDNELLDTGQDLPTGFALSAKLVFKILLGLVDPLERHY
jgi:hypothetical protein